MTHEALARKLRILRAARGITLAEAEELTGVTRETLGALEHGQRGAYTSTLEKIADGYGTTVGALLTEEPEVSTTGKASAPPETGRPSIADVISDAANRQLALERKDEGPMIDMSPANDAMRRLREEYGLGGNDAEELFDLALQAARRNEEIARLREAGEARA